MEFRRNPGRDRLLCLNAAPAQVASLDRPCPDTLRLAALRRLYFALARGACAMSSAVKIIECPRDAWQGLPKPIPAEIKADYLRTLVADGFRHIDAVSFVSPQA